MSRISYHATDGLSGGAAGNENISFPHPCLSFDLEAKTGRDRIDAFAAIRSDTRESICFREGNLQAALERLDDFARGASFLLGHNLINFDLPYLKAEKPGLRFLKLPLIDTLWLSPLAFPRNPYHFRVQEKDSVRAVGGGCA